MNEPALRHWVEDNPALANSGNWLSGPPLFRAVELGSPALVTWLVDEKGADVNIRNDFNGAPLYYATSSDVVTILLNGGADVIVPDAFNRLTPLMAQVNQNRVECVKRLLQNSCVVASIEAQTDDGRTALKCACGAAMKNLLVPLLLQAGANPTKINLSPFHPASHLI